MERGGKTVYGATVGILMLDTRFPRIPGDMGNAFTWPFPVQYRVVSGATPQRVVRERADGLLERFKSAACGLVAQGADGITTNCGFLSLFQDELKQAAGVPVAASSLMQIPWINSMLPRGRRAGVLTISAATLEPDHLMAANAPLDTPVVGTEGGQEFTGKILGDAAEIDFALCREDMRMAASELVSCHDDLGAIVLECTNMVPFAAEIRKLTGLPVFSAYTHICWLQSGLLPRRFTSALGDPGFPEKFS
ncbi:MAG: aspartate/glutamate racemase family protein [Rhodobacteraceae bacterium]|nr:aspartate/glutamate racemase family protein [Paracoccaceae bacterium]